ncbi:hypothetical protein J2Y55_001115 [Bosea sp. BE125]|uniref:helicase RepA family protein n=1 Tax=Bosea sp. BE125 TaxID=2817909 RepID=UPI002867577D|nr:helicase RepA family protein [Bosea sp. BE125]MDR6870115.1 hypothetical protein [Bosea sp. BE125]
MPTSNIEPKPNGINGHMPQPSLADYLSQKMRGASEATSSARQPRAVLTINLTTLESRRALTKNFEIGATGKIEGTGRGEFSNGTATRTQLTGDGPADVLHGLAELLCGLSSRQAIVTTAPPAGANTHKVVTKKELRENPGSIARSSEHFRAAPGPSLLMIDFDTRAYPGSLRSQIEAAGDLSAVLRQVFPGFRDAASLCRNSASTGVWNVATGEQTSDSGQHRYYVVADGLDAADFVERLHKRLIIAGYGFGTVRQSGVVGICSPVDVSASAPERIVYEANAELGDGLAHIANAREPTVSDGGLLDTRALPALSPDEEHDFLAQCENIRHALREEAEAQRAVWIEKRVAERMAKGESEDRARRSLRGAAERHELSGNSIDIVLDDGGTVTPAEILANPGAYHEKTCADPLEPEYGGGRNLAIIYAEGRGRPIIHSQAHGGIQYVLWPDLDAHFTDLEDEPNAADDPQSVFQEQSKAPSGLKFLSIADVLERGLEDAVEPLVDGLLDRGALSVLYGDSNVGKTFVAMSLAFSVACGSPWAGQRTAGLPVVYVAAEGGRGAMRRLHALVCESGRHDAAFHLYPSSVDLLRADADLEPLIAAIRAADGVGLVVIDTLSRALAGGDENSSVDMGKLVRHIDRLRSVTKAHVIIVHHSGKNQAKGARGHSLLRAATDTEIEVTAGQMEVTKQRDMEGAFKRAFRLNRVVLGFDRNDRVVSSCTVAFDAELSQDNAHASSAATRAEEEVLDALRRLHKTSPSARGFSAQEISDSGLLKGSNAETLRTHLRHLAGKNQVEKISRGMWALRAIRDGRGSENASTGSVSTTTPAASPDALSGEHSVHGCYTDIFQ